jgi:hypothetical protein
MSNLWIIPISFISSSPLLLFVHLFVAATGGIIALLFSIGNGMQANLTHRKEDKEAAAVTLTLTFLFVFGGLYALAIFMIYLFCRYVIFN